MKLREVIEAMKSPCHVSYTDSELLDMEVVFNTSDHIDLELLSTYTHEGKIQVDVGGGS